MASFASAAYPMHERKRRALPLTPSTSRESSTMPPPEQSQSGSVSSAPEEQASAPPSQSDPGVDATSATELRPVPVSPSPPPPPAPSPSHSVLSPQTPPPPPNVTSSPVVESDLPVLLSPLRLRPTLRPRPKPLQKPIDNPPPIRPPITPLTGPPALIPPQQVLEQAGCPSGLLQAFEPVTTAEFDVMWTACALAFARQQVAAGFQDPKGAVLSSHERPAEFAAWFKQHRHPDGVDIQSHSEFLATLHTWWRSLQPAIRGSAGVLRPAGSSPDEWVSLVKPGKNGIFLILCGLLWIGNAIFKHGEIVLMPGWVTLVDDVTWVLNCEVRYGPQLVVPTAEEVDSPSVTNSKRPRRRGSEVPRKRKRT